MFNNLKTLQYPYDRGVELAGIALANLPLRLNIDKSYIIEDHVVSDGEGPESLAYRLYKDANLHWVILYINSIRNPYEEWPMRHDFVKDWADTKFGFDTAVVVKHLVDTRTEKQMYGPEARAILEAGAPYPQWVRPVSWYDWCVEKNNARRNIIAISPRHVRDFVDMYEELIK